MAKKRKTGLQQNASSVHPDIVADLRELCSTFTKILSNTGIEAHEMQGDLGRLLDIYISLCYLTSDLTLKTDLHIGKLIAYHYHTD